MRLSFKAALFSALIMPGAGHCLLKRYVFAAFYVCLSVSAVIIITTFAFFTIQELSEQIVLQNIPLDVSAITEVVINKLSNRPTYVKIASYGLVCLWLVSTIHAFFIGRKEENRNETNL